MVIAMSSIALAAEDPVQPNAPRNNVSPTRQTPSWLGSSVPGSFVLHPRKLIAMVEGMSGVPLGTALGAPWLPVGRGSSDSWRRFLGAGCYLRVQWLCVHGRGEIG